uniref:Uncharacterized protein n=1 Tax=Tetraselmis sp. GSL018 TaxID=582737 RepID=A0A061RUG7_9CHLO
MLYEGSRGMNARLSGLSIRVQGLLEIGI